MCSVLQSYAGQAGTPALARDRETPAVADAKQGMHGSIETSGQFKNNVTMVGRGTRPKGASLPQPPAVRAADPTDHRLP